MSRLPCRCWPIPFMYALILQMLARAVKVSLHAMLQIVRRLLPVTARLCVTDGLKATMYLR